MNKFYAFLFIAMSAFSTKAVAQTFTDNFDSYTSGNYLGLSSTTWKTWSNSPGGSDDVRISSAKAKSGSNSLYFSSTSGGPSDIVLPFGGQYNTGTLNISMNMFVDNQKKGYFNLQEQTTLGKGWSIDVNFDSLGQFNLVNTLSGELLKGSYTQNTWMKVELQINLNTNTWNFLIDGVSKGIFQNAYRQIASMDIYPTTNSSYYIDDVSYTYASYIKPNLNGTVTSINNVLGSLAGQIVTPSVEIRNIGTQVITSASIEFTYNSVKQTKNVSGLNLASLATTSITLDNSITLLAGASTVSAEVKLVNGVADDNTADNLKVLNVSAPVPAADKFVVAEEATGTWCQWCPRGAVWLKKMDDKYTNLIIGIAVHNNDPMTFSPYDKGIGPKISGYPSMLVDRGTSKDPSAMEGDFLARIMIAPKGVIRGGAKYNATTKVLDVSLTTKFKTAVTGNYRIAFVLVEDSVTGTSSKYSQSNAYAGGGSGVMGGFELLSNPVPANKMVYDHVGRIISPNFAGLSNAFATSINPGDSFTHNFQVVIDPTWNIARLHIVGLLIDPSGKIDNGSTVTMSKAIQNGFLTGNLVTGITSLGGPETSNVYPNPSNKDFTIALPESFRNAETMMIYNMQGQCIQTEKIKGQENILVPAETWTPGFYLGVINHNGTVLQVKLIKE